MAKFKFVEWLLFWLQPVSEERLGIVGTTSGGRILQVVFTLRGGKIRPISARPAHKKERELYEAYLREV